MKKIVFTFSFISLFISAGAVGSPGGSALQSTHAPMEVGGLAGSSSFIPLNHLAGVYRGTAYSGGDCSVTTELFVGKAGNISGRYTMTKAGESVEGWLEEFYIENAHTLVATWKDKYGSGILRMFFITDDASRFSGYWGPDYEHARMQWDGKKQRTRQ